MDTTPGAGMSREGVGPARPWQPKPWRHRLRTWGGQAWRQLNTLQPADQWYRNSLRNRYLGPRYQWGGGGGGGGGGGYVAAAPVTYAGENLVATMDKAKQLQTFIVTAIAPYAPKVAGAIGLGFLGLSALEAMANYITEVGPRVAAPIIAAGKWIGDAATPAVPSMEDAARLKRDIAAGWVPPPPPEEEFNPLLRRAWNWVKKDFMDSFTLPEKKERKKLDMEVKKLDMEVKKMEKEVKKMERSEQRQKSFYEKRKEARKRHGPAWMMRAWKPEVYGMADPVTSYTATGQPVSLPPFQWGGGHMFTPAKL